ncbi:MAG: glycosyltransferase family 2 protein [bacterium]|nr:glycosyltransferase family 2 protein [bacterium]
MSKVISISSKTPFISIVIANYNGENYLRTCLTSLLKSSIKNYEVIIIDNNSTDTSIKIVNEFQKKDKRIKLLRNEVNLGVPASRNIAISKCRGEIVILLDNDTEVKKDSLEQLIKPLLENEEIGAAQALLIDFENRNLIQMAGGHLIPQAIWLMGFYESQEYEKVKFKLGPTNIIAISAALAVKKEVLDKIGGYDSLLYNYTDDLDFSWRIWIAGYRVILVPQSIVYHYTKSIARRANIGANKFDIYFQLAKNSFRSILKNYEIINVIRYLPISILVNLSRAILVLIRRRDVSALLATLYSIWWSFINLPNTLQSRAKTQDTRKLSDEKILNEVFVKGSLLDIYNRNYRSSKLLW